jgi:MHS family shikimate/dehydroshikimate transporter-like MFS transporter
LLIIALRLAELFTMYIVTAFALSYSTTNLGMPRQFFLNIGLLVGAVSIYHHSVFRDARRPFWPPPHLHDRRVVGMLSAIPFFLALDARSTVWIVIFSVMLANIAHDMVVSVQQPMFTELFGTEYRYSGAGVGYQVASVVGGGFTPFIAVALVSFAGGSWHPVAAYLGDWLPDLRAGCRAA